MGLLSLSLGQGHVHPVLVLVVQFTRPVFESSPLQHSLCLETRNLEETTQYRSVSPWLWPSLATLCLVMPLCMPPGRGCCCPSTAVCSLAMINAALFPWLRPCWPWSVFVLLVPVPLQVGRTRACVQPGPALAEAGPSCSWQAAQLHGPGLSAAPCCWRAPGAVMEVPAETRCGVRSSTELRHM